ncbi:protein hu-li tai shao isoform X3 [Planococcus citri]|uniref:protein hu-li tai shao isoform X3 n=1 Tax=Planococcus citri TaxID=170843 RepID=UPI0031FA235E
MSAVNTESIPPSHTNGVIEDGYDEDEKMKVRPADIDADMREMERRKRVESIMNSRLFREELERIIESQIKAGNSSAGLLQQISDMVGSKYSGINNHLFRSTSCAVPINDIRGVEAMGYAKGEKILRCKLAALFRLIDLYGWTQGIYNHVTARLSQQEEHFLVNPYGLLYSEVTASSLVKVDMQGNVIESGTTNFSVNVTGFQLHAAIYAARPDLKCIVHLHTPSVLAVSSLKDGLLPICQEAAVIGEISHHSYIGIPNEPEERDKIVRNLGPNNKVIFLTNHGALCCGETIEETFFYAYNTVNACETQLKVLPLGKDNVVLLSDETRKSMYDSARKIPENISPPVSHVPSAAAATEKRWRIGGLEFEALMRMLDNAGFRTGYVYRQPLIKGELPRPRNDVEVPPAVSSLGYLLEEEELYKGQWKKAFGGKGSDRIRWLNSPNVYQKVEILETGTSDPKKITKWVDANNEEWVADGSPSHTSTPVKIENALQFVPKNTNPKEFKKLQQQIKENRRADKITSGPQSHILEGVSWEEAKKLQDANISGTSDQVILVGAASKGIIQREYQHNATVYKTPYAKNPFDAVTDEEIENYKKDITRKQRGDSYYDEDESDALSSSLPPSEMRVIQIETTTVPKASQAEVVLSDDKANRKLSKNQAATKAFIRGENTYNGDHSDALQTTFSHSSKEGSPSKDISTEDSSKKEKKKKKGLRTPSFLKKKKEKKKQVEA